jgi:hypothetical protein
MPNTPRWQQRREATQNRAHAQLRRADALGARRDPMIDGVAKLFELDPCDESLVDQFQFMLDQYEEEQELFPNWLEVAPTADQLYPAGTGPDFTVGTVSERGFRYGPRIADCSSIWISGIIGGGKSTLIQHLVTGTMQHFPHTAILLLDSKRDTPCLASLGPRVVVVTTNEIRLNVLSVPPGATPAYWSNIVTRCFCEIYGLRQSRHILTDELNNLYDRFHTSENPDGPEPSMVNLLQSLQEKTRPRFGKQEYVQAMVTPLHGLVRETESMLDTCRGISVVNEMLMPGRVFSLLTDTLSQATQQFIGSIIIEHFSAYQLAQNIHNPPLRLLVVLDEATALLATAADALASSSVSPLATLILRGRELGIAFVVVGHMPAQLSRAVLVGAKTCYVVGGLPDATNVGVAADIMHLSPRATGILSHIPKGQALAREAGQSYSHPFLVTVDPPSIRKDGVSEAMRRQLMAPILATFPATPSLPLPKEAKPKAKRAVTAGAEPGPPVPALSDRQLAVLRHCCEFPQLFSTERMPALKVNDYHQFDGVVEQLAKLYLVTIHTPQLGSHKYTFIEVTETGWAAAGMDKPAGYIGHGGVLHTVLIARVAEHLRQLRWQDVRTEHPVGPAGHRVDVYGIQNGVRTGLEISLSLSNVVDNALNSAIGQESVQSLIFLCDVASNCRKVESILQKTPELEPHLDRICVERIDQHVSLKALSS